MIFGDGLTERAVPIDWLSLRPADFRPCPFRRGYAVISLEAFQGIGAVFERPILIGKEDHATAPIRLIPKNDAHTNDLSEISQTTFGSSPTVLDFLRPWNRFFYAAVRLWRQIDVRSYLECGLTGRDKALDGHSVDAPDTAAADAVATTIFRKSRRLSLIDMAKPPYGLTEEG
jgi:hypothetical protein